MTIDDSGLLRRISLVASRKAARELNEQIGSEVLERVKDHLDMMSVSRHKTADRLGAPHTRYFEYASGRLGGSPLGQTTKLDSVTESSATIYIKNTPGLARAFRDLVITPKKAKALTIPLHRIAYGKRVADLERDGHKIFRPKGTNILAEASGKKGIRPLYALVAKTVVPKDEGLLPSREEIAEWATDATEQFFESRNRLG